MAGATSTPFGTLPALEVVDWPRLEEAREELEATAGELDAATRAERELRERFDGEDAALEREVEAAVREGREPTLTASATPDVRRRVELRIAGENVEAARSRQRASASRVARSLVERWDDVEAAIGAARARDDLYETGRLKLDREVSALTGLHVRLTTFLAPAA